MSIARHRFESSIKDIAKNRLVDSKLRTSSISRQSTTKSIVEKRMNRQTIYKSMADRHHSAIDVGRIDLLRSADASRYDTHQSLVSLDDRCQTAVDIDKVVNIVDNVGRFHLDIGCIQRRR